MLADYNDTGGDGDERSITCTVARLMVALAMTESLRG